MCLKMSNECLHRPATERWVDIFPKVSNKIHLKTAITQAAGETGVVRLKFGVVCFVDLINLF